MMFDLKKGVGIPWILASLLFPVNAPLLIMMVMLSGWWEGFSKDATVRRRHCLPCLPHPCYWEALRDKCISEESVNHPPGTSRRSQLLGQRQGIPVPVAACGALRISKVEQTRCWWHRRLHRQEGSNKTGVRNWRGSNTWKHPVSDRH